MALTDARPAKFFRKKPIIKRVEVEKVFWRSGRTSSSFLSVYLVKVFEKNEKDKLVVVFFNVEGVL